MVSKLQIKFKSTETLSKISGDISCTSLENKKEQLSTFLRKLLTNALANQNNSNNNNSFDEF